MTETSRIDDLRRRVQTDPASIAFAQLAEECRRAGHLQEAVDVCRAGLAVHPRYISARVTLGRALAQLGSLGAAQHELQRVLSVAPQNLAALRASAEILHAQGHLVDALALYRSALVLASNDPEIQLAESELAQALSREQHADQRERSLRQIAALEQWLSAIHGTRAHRSA